MINEITQSISPITPLPGLLAENRPAAVNTLVEQELPQNSIEMQSLVGQVNTFIGQTNTTADEVLANATLASNAAAVAVANANYKGDWVAGFNTTGYSLGMSVTYADGYNYSSKINNNLTEPTTLQNTTEWNFIEAVNPNNYYLKTETYNKAEVDSLTSINNKTDKSTPLDTDNLMIQETAGLFKKLSWSNLKTTLKTYFDTLYVKLTPTIATGTATFTNATNNINLTGVGIGVEVGDVIILSGSTNNNGEFTVEVITDANNIIVNQAHAGRSRTVSPIGPKALINETATVTVKLLSKGYNADSALGRDWIEVTPNRAININYPNITNRAIEISVSVRWYNNNGVFDYIISDDVKIAEVGTDNSATSVTISQLYAKIQKGKNYKLVKISLGDVVIWSELR